MRKYATDNYAANTVGLPMSKYQNKNHSVQLRQLDNKDSFVFDSIRQELAYFVENNAPQFDGSKGQTFSIKEVRSLNLSDDDLVKHTLDCLLQHFTQPNKLREQIDQLTLWNDYPNERENNLINTKGT